MPEHISRLNLETVRMLVDAWADLAEEAKTGKPKKKKPATMTDIKKFQALLQGVQ